MREILFRAKRKFDNEWIYGYPYITQCKCFELLHYSSQFNAEHLCPEVIPETVGQYTGLTDKNGRRIFEGDIVKYAGEIHQVVFEQRNGNAYFGIAINNIEAWKFCCEVPADKMEVIGNIYDDPELVKEVKS